MTRPAVPHRLAGLEAWNRISHEDSLRELAPAETMQPDMTPAFRNSMNPWFAAAWGFVFGVLAVVVLVEAGL